MVIHIRQASLLMTAPLRTLTAARTNKGQLFVCLLPPIDRIAGDTDIMVPLVAIPERDPDIAARARFYDDGADFDYAMEAEAHGVSVVDLIGRVA